MKSLPILSLLVGTAAVADPATKSPDFVAAAPARHLDRSLVASSAETSIQPWEDVDFALDSAALEGPAREQLEVAAAWLREHPGYRIVVEGHTDRLGTRVYNLDLAQRRADVASKYLHARGIANDRIVEAIYGENGAPRGIQPLDRRVVLWASKDSREHLAAVTLDHTSAVTVEWSNRGAKLEETTISRR